MSLAAIPSELRTTGEWDFSGLRAVYVNCTLKPSPERSHTQGLIDLSAAIMRASSNRRAMSATSNRSGLTWGVSAVRTSQTSASSRVVGILAASDADPR